MVQEAPDRDGRGGHGVLRADRPAGHAQRRDLVACPAGPAGLGHARGAGRGLLVAGVPAPGPAGRDSHPGRLHPGHLAADLAGLGLDARARRGRLGAVLDHPCRLRAGSVLAEPPGRVPRGRPADRGRRPAVAAVAAGHLDRRGQDHGRAAGRAVLRGAPAAGPGAAGARGTCGTGAVPARRAGPRRGAGPAGRGDARHRHPPGQPDGAAGGGPADDRSRRGDQAGRRGAPRGWLPGPGRTARPGRHPAHGAGGRPGPGRAGVRRAGRRVDRGRHPGRAGRGGRSVLRLTGGRPDRLPAHPRGADQRPQARRGRAGDGAGQLRRGTGQGVGAEHPPTRPAGGALAATGSGLGLASLRQRIELVRGTMRSGPEADGGFCVEAALPSYVPTAETAV